MKKKFRFEPTMIILIFVLIYFVAWMFIYFSKNKVTYYEVMPGEMVESDRFTGMVMCNDKIEYVPEAGNIYFIARNGSKVSTSTPIYYLDKAGNIQQIITESENEQLLNEDQIDEIYDETVTFANSYTDIGFSRVYQLKSSTTSILLDSLSTSLINKNESNSLTVVRPFEPGYVFYFQDGLEGVTRDSFTPDMLDTSKYSATSLSKEGSVTSGDAGYKLITSEDWEVIFKLNEYQYEKYIQDEYVQVRFLKDNQIIWGQIDLIEIENEVYCAIKFTNSLIRYAGNRFIDIEVIFSSESGLKVPNSSIVVKEFYTIPKDYATVNGNTLFVNVYSVSEDSKLELKEKELDIYDETEEYYLVSTNDLEKDTEIIQDVSGNVYTVSNTVPINGVYNINRGYAKFNEVTILTNNDDFSIIKPNDTYGLVEYDHIVLNGDSVVDEEIIHQE